MEGSKQIEREKKTKAKIEKLVLMSSKIIGMKLEIICFTHCEPELFPVLLCLSLADSQVIPGLCSELQ